MRNKEQRLNWQHANAWTPDMYRQFLADCGVLKRHREKLAALSIAINANKISPKQSIKNREAFEAFKNTPEHRDIVSAANGFRRIIDNDVKHKNLQQFPWETSNKVRQHG